MTDFISPSAEELKRALIDLSVDSWRFTKAFSRMVARLDPGEASRYDNQYRFYIKRITESLELGGLRLVNVENLPFDAGMAVNALNLGDFAPDDPLEVEQMIEPIIMSADALVRSGTVTLRRAAA